MIELFLAFSHHLLPGDWNEVHPGLRVQHEAFVAGVYHNSEDDTSVFAAYDFGNLELGLVTGYEGGPVIPFVRATYELEQATLFATPAVKTTGEFGLVIGVEIGVTLR